MNELDVLLESARSLLDSLAASPGLPEHTVLVKLLKRPDVQEILGDYTWHVDKALADRLLLAAREAELSYTVDVTREQRTTIEGWPAWMPSPTVRVVLGNTYRRRPYE